MIFKIQNTEQVVVYVHVNAEFISFYTLLFIIYSFVFSVWYTTILVLAIEISSSRKIRAEFTLWFAPITFFVPTTYEPLMWFMIMIH